MYSVCNIDPTDETAHTVHFASKEEKDDFLTNETRFCKDAQKNLSASKGKVEREKFKRQLFNRRMEFLKREHFQQQENYNWVKIIVDQLDDNDNPPQPPSNNFTVI